jgi:hypothetical protein
MPQRKSVAGKLQRMEATLGLSRQRISQQRHMLIGTGWISSAE